MAEDAEAYGRDIELKKTLRKNNPLPPLPYPNWDTHAAKYLLRQDIADRKCGHDVKPKQLHLTGPEYQEFLFLGIFRDHIYQESDCHEKVMVCIEKRNCVL